MKCYEKYYIKRNECINIKWLNFTKNNISIKIKRNMDRKINMYLFLTDLSLKLLVKKQ